MKKWLPALLLLSSLCSAEEFKTITIGKFLGLNNTDTSVIIPDGQSPDLLNVDATPGGVSVKKRKGYGTAFTLSNATSAVHGIYNAYDTDGSDFALFFNDRNINRSVSGASPSVIFSTATSGATYQCVDSEGFAYCANTARDAIFKIDSSAVTLLTGFTSTGTMVAVTPERLVQAGFSATPNRIDFSKPNDFATWTPGSTNADPIRFTITSPGSGIKHITYAHGRVYWFKDSSFGYIQEGQTSSQLTSGDGWEVRTINSFIGTIHNTSIYRDDVLYFQGNDGHFYGWDGSSLKKLSRDIQSTIDDTQGVSNNNWTQTTKADWDASSITPAGYLDTSLIDGSVVLSTMVGLSPFVDTSSANFISGTLVNLTTSHIDGSLMLQEDSNTNFIYFTQASGPSDLPTCAGIVRSQSFFSTYSLTLNYFQTTIQRSGTSTPYTLQCSLRSDDSGSAGDILSSVDVNIGTYSTTSSSPLRCDVPDYGLKAGTTYWIALKSDASCSDTVRWFYSGSDAFQNGRSDFNSSLDFRFILSFLTFKSTGSFISRTFDVAQSTNQWMWAWNNFYASGTLTNLAPGDTTDIDYFFQTSPDGVNWNSITSISTGNFPTSSIQRYVRYSASFTASTELINGVRQLESPIVDDVIINLAGFKRPSGYLNSQVHNAPNLSAWGTFDVTHNTGGGNISYFVRASTGIFYATATSPSFTSITPGSIPSISTNSYLQFQSSFSITSSTQDPRLDAATFNWLEGSNIDKSYAIYHDNSNWWAVTSGVGSTTNNKIIKHDLLNNQWFLYDIPMSGMYVRNQSLYFGSPSSGKVFVFGTADDDDGSEINSYWKSKDFIAEGPFVDKDFLDISLSGKGVSNSSMTVTYEINGSSSADVQVPMSNGSDTYVDRNFNLPLGINGKTISLKFGNNASNQPFELFGSQISYMPSRWRPE